MLWLNHPISIAFCACVLIQVVAWYRQKQTNNADTVDMAWTLGIILSTLIYAYLLPSSFHNFVIVLLFPVLWYVRLLYHLIIRYDYLHEDSRYQNLRAHWSDFTQLKFFSFFMFQACLSVIFSLSAYWVLSGPAVSIAQIIIATSLGTVAFIGVSTADHQLLQFKRSHDKSQVCDIGLWQYSRHPNYFFEWIHWFVYPVLLWNSSYFGWSILVVILMLLFLVKFTGIPFSEQQALNKRGQAYLDYMNKTSPFILWRPKHD